MEETEKNYYFIEGVSQKDIIGFDSYILTLKNAIKTIRSLLDYFLILVQVKVL